MAFEISFSKGKLVFIEDAALPKYLFRLKETIEKEETKFLKKFYFKTFYEIYEIKTGKKISNIDIYLKFMNGLSYTYCYAYGGLNTHYYHDNLEEATTSFNDLYLEDVFEPHQKLIKHIKVIEREFTFEYE